MKPSLQLPQHVVGRKGLGQRRHVAYSPKWKTIYWWALWSTTPQKDNTETHFSSTRVGSFWRKRAMAFSRAAIATEKKKNGRLFFRDEDLTPALKPQVVQGWGCEQRYGFISGFYSRLRVSFFSPTRQVSTPPCVLLFWTAAEQTMLVVGWYVTYNARARHCFHRSPCGPWHLAPSSPRLQSVGPCVWPGIFIWQHRIYKRHVSDVVLLSNCVF